jgi:hypothetical protein
MIIGCENGNWIELAQRFVEYPCWKSSYGGAEGEDRKYDRTVRQWLLFVAPTAGQVTFCPRDVISWLPWG